MRPWLVVSGSNPPDSPEIRDYPFQPGDVGLNGGDRRRNGHQARRSGYGVPCGRRASGNRLMATPAQRAAQLVGGGTRGPAARRTRPATSSTVPEPSTSTKMPSRR